MTALVLAGQATIDLPNLWIFNKLYAAATKAKAEHAAFIDSLNNVLAIYEDKWPEHQETIKRLRLDIRLITKGTPVTEALDSTRLALYSDPNFNEEAYNAHSVLLTQTYRKVARLVHPDLGGSKEQFQDVAAAYRNRDLQRLIDIYVTIALSRNLYWQASAEGLDYASTELERPRAERARIKASSLFTVVRAHHLGRSDLATELMGRNLYEDIIKLQNELNFIRERNGNQG